MSTYQKKKYAYWNRLEQWKSDVEKIKSPDCQQYERSEAFCRVREQLQGVYNNVASRTARLLELEGRAVGEFVDEVLYRCAVKFDLSRNGFFKFFKTAVNCAIINLARNRSRRICKPDKDGVIEWVGKEEPGFKKVEDEVNLDLLLSPRQRRVSECLIQGYLRPEIQKRFHITRYGLDQTVSHIRDAMTEMMEG